MQNWIWILIAVVVLMYMRSSKKCCGGQCGEQKKTEGTETTVPQTSVAEKFYGVLKDSRRNDLLADRDRSTMYEVNAALPLTAVNMPRIDSRQDSL